MVEGEKARPRTGWAFLFFAQFTSVANSLQSLNQRLLLHLLDKPVILLGRERIEQLGLDLVLHVGVERALAGAVALSHLDDVVPAGDLHGMAGFPRRAREG